MIDFELIYKIYWQKIYRLCIGFLNDQEWAKDITQDIFIIVYKELPKFRNDASIGTWIFRIATNNCLRQIEKSKKMLKTEINREFEDIIQPNKDKKTDFLYKCISELQEIERIIISLELEEVKQSEIALIVGITETNVRVKIHRIKEKIAIKFKNYEEYY